MSGDTLELVEVWKCPTCGTESMHAVPLESNPICFHCSHIPNYQYLKFVERRRVDPQKEPVWRTGPQRSPGEGGLVMGELEVKRKVAQVINTLEYWKNLPRRVVSCNDERYMIVEISIHALQQQIDKLKDVIN